MEVPRSQAPQGGGGHKTFSSPRGRSGSSDPPAGGYAYTPGVLSLEMVHWTMLIRPPRAGVGEPLITTRVASDARTGHDKMPKPLAQHPCYATSATISRRWKGLERTLACLGASDAGCNATAAKPVMNMIFRAAFSFRRALGQLDPVHPGHHDIGEQEVEGEAFEAFPGVRAVAEIGHGMAGANQRRR